MSPSGVKQLAQLFSCSLCLLGQIRYLRRHAWFTRSLDRVDSQRRCIDHTRVLFFLINFFSHSLFGGLIHDSASRTNLRFCHFRNLTGLYSPPRKFLPPSNSRHNVLLIAHLYQITVAISNLSFRHFNSRVENT